MSAPGSHPLQPIRDGIEAVYIQAVANRDENVQALALALLIELDRLRGKAGLPPICRGPDACST
jgi:hypothetical protein